MRFVLGVVVAVLLGASAAMAADSKTHRVQKIVDDVYLLETNEAGISSNAMVVVNQNDVLLVDSHNDPRSARQLIDAIKTITPKPVRYVVNTHFHFDHTGGNEVFSATAEIIGSVFTHHQLATGGLRGRTAQQFIGSAGSEVKKAETLRAAAGQEPDATRKATLLKQAGEIEAANASFAKAVDTPSTIVVKDKVVLHRGGREIQVIFPGRGHTAGDLIVFLPKEGIVATGDFFQTGGACCGFPGDFYPVDYVKSLDVLKALDFNIVVPGHGAVLTGDEGKKRVTAYQQYLLDFWNQMSTFKKQGLSALEASRKLDMTAHKVNFPNARGPAEFTGEQPNQAVVRSYELLEGRDPYAKDPY